MKTKKQVLNSTVIVTLIILLTRIVLLIKEIIFANLYGATNISDAYSIAFSGITTIETVISATILAYLPVYFEYKRRGDKELVALVSSFYAIILAITVAVGGIMFLFSNFFIRIFAPGFNSQVRLVSEDIFRWMLMSFPVFLFVTVQQQHLRAEEEFFVPAFSNLLISLCLLCSVIVTSLLYGVIGLAASFTLIYFLQFVYQQFILYKKSFKLSLIRFEWNGCKTILLLSLPMLIGGSVESITSMITRSTASMFGEGSVTVINYSLKFAILIVGVFTAGPGNIIYANMARFASDGKNERFIDYYKKTIHKLMYSFVPITILMIMHSEFVVNFFFSAKKFQTDTLYLMVINMQIFSLSIIPHILRIIVTRAYYSVKEVFIPNILAIFSIAVEIIFIIGLRRSGLIGLSMANVAAIWAGTVALLYKFDVKYNTSVKKKSKIVIKIIISCIILVFVNRILYAFTFQLLASDIIIVTISVTGALLMYYLTSRMLNIAVAKDFYIF